MFNYNVEIETALTGAKIEHGFMHYDGDASTYVVYMQTDKSGVLEGDDSILGCVQYYDFDIYSTGNYLSTVSTVIETMEGFGWTYQPSRDSPDMYETDTRYYHKTICMAKESQRIEESEE